jgi:hypothetical protein
MQLILPDLQARAELWFYLASDYILTHVMDDPAWLALLFC